MRRPLMTLLGCCLLLASEAVVAQNTTLDEMIEKTVNLRTHSLSGPYVDSDLQNRWWDFGGDSIINTNKHVRLTQDRPSQKGWLWSRMPLSISNWQIDFEFKVDGKAHNIFGDGFAFWITKDRAQPGPVFGSKDYFEGIGIFFDTYANTRHAYQFPRVTMMIGDGQTEYDHGGDNEAHEAAACSENFRRRDIPTKARLTYVKGQPLQLKLQTKNAEEWTTCFEYPVTLPESPYVGFTAATGDVSDNHDIVSVSTASLTLKREYREQQHRQAPMIADPTASRGRSRAGAAFATHSAKRKSKPKAKSSGAASWFLFILKGIGVLAFIAFALAAYRTYNAQQKSRRTW